MCFCADCRQLRSSISHIMRAWGFPCEEAVQSGVRDANTTRSALSPANSNEAGAIAAFTRLNFSRRAHTLISISINFFERGGFNLWMYKIKLAKMNILSRHLMVTTWVAPWRDQKSYDCMGAFKFCVRGDKKEKRIFRFIGFLNRKSSRKIKPILCCSLLGQWNAQEKFWKQSEVADYK